MSLGASSDWLSVRERPRDLAGAGLTGEALAWAPCSSTLFRWRLQSLIAGGEIADPAAGLPAPLRALWRLRLQGIRTRIAQARGADQLVSLAGEAVPPADAEWHARVREMGPRILPELTQAFWKEDQTLDRPLALQNLAGAHLWLGEEAGAALVARLLDISGGTAALASVVLGLGGSAGAGDAIARFHEIESQFPARRHFVGGLWGLLDLRDRRAPAAIAQWIESGTRFYELYGMAWLCRDDALIIPLMCVLQSQREPAERTDALMVLATIASSIGAVEFEAHLRSGFQDQEADAHELVATVIGISPARAARHFEAFSAESRGPQ